MRTPTFLRAFTDRRTGVMALLGLSSGMPLLLTGGTMQAWLATADIDIRTIGLFSAIGIPYTLKFLWSPLLDRFRLPLLGRRRGWVLLTQLALAAGIAGIGLLGLSRGIGLLAATALLVAFVSASQDIVIDAYRTDVLPEQQRGSGAAVFVLGYRIAMLLSGALVLILSDRIGWTNSYLIMAGVMVFGIAGTFTGPEPDVAVRPPKTLKDAVIDPFREYFSRPGAAGILILIVLYKLGDAYAGSLTPAFLIKEIGFSAGEVGAVNKGFGLVSTIVGALVAGGMLARLDVYRGLLYFGILQAVSNLSFVMLALVGRSYPAFIFTVGFENITGGMGTAAFTAFLMSLCNKRFSATQYAILSSLAALGRTVVSPTAGYLADTAGWPLFFFITFLVSLPGLAMVAVTRRRIGRSAAAG